MNFFKSKHKAAAAPEKAAEETGQKAENLEIDEIPEKAEAPQIPEKVTAPQIPEFGKWTCVEDALPKEEGWYLTSGYDDYCTPMVYGASCDVCFYTLNGDAWSDEWMHGHQNCFVGTYMGKAEILYEVYYWMPLPSIPKQTNDDIWINTADRFPKKDDFCLTYSYSEKEDMTKDIWKRIKVQFFDREYGDSSNENMQNRRNVFTSDDGRTFSFDNEVKYWSPLPSPPPVWDDHSPDYGHAQTVWYRNHNKIRAKFDKEK